MKKQETNKLHFSKGWCSVGFGKPWDVFGTYGLIPFELLPPVDTSKFRGEFQWLPEIYQTKWDSYSMMADSGENLAKIFSSANELGIDLPYDFKEFMQSFGDQNNMISVTDCYFWLSKDILIVPGDEPVYFIRFMEDGQSVIHWYLYIDKDGNAWVTTSNYTLEGNFPKNVSLDEKLKGVVLSSPSFEEFLYRFWIETRIWIANCHNFPLTNEEDVYMNKAIENINNFQQNKNILSSFKKLIHHFAHLIDPKCKTYLKNKLIRLEQVNKKYDLEAGKKIIEDLNESLFRLSYQERNELTIHTNFGVVLFTMRKLSEPRLKDSSGFREKVIRFNSCLHESHKEPEWNVIKISGIYAELYETGTFITGSMQCPKCGTFNNPSDLFCSNKACRASWAESIDFDIIQDET